MMKVLIAISLMLFVMGCASSPITPKTPVELSVHFIKHPLGLKPPLRLGMAKEEVRERWGKPKEINPLETDRWGTSREEWIYAGRFEQVPVGYNYLSATTYLHFDGNNLTSFKEEKK